MMIKIGIRCLTFGLLAAGMPGVIASVATPAATTAPDTLTVAWRNKPPYHYIENGIEHGFLLERARKIFATAGVPTKFVEEPSKRIWANFAAGVKSYCSIGWYRLPERERIAQFSIPFHTDPPHTMLVAPAALVQVGAHRTLASLLNDTALTMGVVDGVSYGPVLDAKIKTTKNHVDRETVEPMIMTRMVAANRVSFMFIDQDDLDYLRAHEESMKGAAQHDFPDMPPGLERYIICSKDVPVEVMVKLNKAIEIVGVGKKSK